mgnify:CR=1 FL=1
MTLYATHRVFTGRPVSRGYIYDRDTGRCVWACPHRHRYRHARRAQECADRELRRRRRRGHGTTTHGWVAPLLTLVRRYRAPILDRVLVGLGVLAIVIQTLLIVWILS